MLKARCIYIPEETLLFIIPFVCPVLGALQREVLLHRERSTEEGIIYLVPGEVDSISEELTQYWYNCCYLCRDSKTSESLLCWRVFLKFHVSALCKCWTVRGVLQQIEVFAFSFTSWYSPKNTLRYWYQRSHLQFCVSKESCLHSTSLKPCSNNQEVLLPTLVVELSTSGSDCMSLL